jgi:hypothetical protein
MKTKISILDKVAIVFFFILLTLAAICFEIKKVNTSSGPSVEISTTSTFEF